MQENISPLLHYSVGNINEIDHLHNGIMCLDITDYLHNCIMPLIREKSLKYFWDMNIQNYIRYAYQPIIRAFSFLQLVS